MIQVTNSINQTLDRKKMEQVLMAHITLLFLLYIIKTLICQCILYIYISEMSDI